SALRTRHLLEKVDENFWKGVPVTTGNAIVAMRNLLRLTLAKPLFEKKGFACCVIGKFVIKARV
ncbi:MAG: hypothetical protein IJ344_03840, partial [Clostridia bacterium]|nr:hypothetical protein [Clostridia bacterium]